MKKRAQAAIEYSMVVFISLILISGFTYYFFEQKTSYEDDTVQSRIDNIGMKVSEFAEEAKYSTGPYRKTFRVNIPEGIERLYVHDKNYIVFETFDGKDFVYESRSPVFGYIENDSIHSGKVIVEKINDKAVICTTAPCNCKSSEIYCDDKADNDCDGYVDGADTDCCDDIDGDGFTGIHFSGVPPYCALGSFAKDCNDTNSSYYPGTSYNCPYDKNCNAVTDDSGCGVIDCSDWYNWTGTVGVTSTQNCYQKADMTSNRCEGLGNCTDPNTIDCETQPNVLNYTCGVCQYIDTGDCDNNVVGSCSNYDSSHSCAPNTHCDGSGNCVCDTGWDDCNGPGDGTDADGCEADLTIDGNCGSCGVSCGINEHCGASGCECDSGWGDCDGLPGNGCETQLNTDSNCGSCGNTCGSGLECDSGSCQSCVRCPLGATSSCWTGDSGNFGWCNVTNWVCTDVGGGCTDWSFNGHCAGGCCDNCLGNPGCVEC